MKLLLAQCCGITGRGRAQNYDYFVICVFASACNAVRWERLQREKTALEVAFERELQELQLQQEAELAEVEEGLRKCHSAEAEHLREEHRSEMVELRTQQQEQVKERHHGRCVRFCSLTEI